MDTNFPMNNNYASRLYNQGVTNISRGTASAETCMSEPFCAAIKLRSCCMVTVPVDIASSFARKREKRMEKFT